MAASCRIVLRAPYIFWCFPDRVLWPPYIHVNARWCGVRDDHIRIGSREPPPGRRVCVPVREATTMAASRASHAYKYTALTRSVVLCPRNGTTVSPQLISERGGLGAPAVPAVDSTGATWTFFQNREDSVHFEQASNRQKADDYTAYLISTPRITYHR